MTIGFISIVSYTLYMLKKIKNKFIDTWDFWIYCRSFHSFKRISEKKKPWSYIMELQLKKYNKEYPLSRELKQSADLFFESMDSYKK